MPPFVSRFFLSWLLCVVSFPLPARSATTEPSATITTARQVLILPPEEASRSIPVHVKGVVTYTEPNWAGQFFVQDPTGGVFVGHSGKSAPPIGTVVEVSGHSHPGAFAPYIEKPGWQAVGTAPLPDPIPIDMERFASGADDGLRVEVTGRLRKVAATAPDKWELIVSSGGQRFEAHLRPNPSNQSVPADWVGSLVRLRGTLAADYQLHRRGLAMVRLFIPSPDDITVTQPAQKSPNFHELLPIARIGQYRRDLAPGQQSRVQGVVVAHLGRDTIAIQDASGGLIVKGSGLSRFAIGDPVEAVGFEELENFLPILQDSEVSKSSCPHKDPVPIHPVVSQLWMGRHHACLVTMDAELIEISARPSADGRSSGRDLVMILQSEGRAFKADVPDTLRPESSPIPFEPGSRIRLTGLCLAEANREGRIDSFRIHLANPESITILCPPPWLTRTRLGLALAITLVCTAISTLWIASSLRKNRRLRAEIREREKLTNELEAAKRQLALRVDERTEELKLQISARKESEVRYMAIIEERTRLAQELHDGVQQGLTGVALQLDTAARLRERLPEQSDTHLELARNLMRQTQAELRSSVWNLRSRSSQEFNLLEALRQSAERMVQGTGIHIIARQTGQPTPLTEHQEENLLRIGQEAINNAIKHADTQTLEIILHYNPDRLFLRIRDFGTGFSPGGAPGPADGHFGLSGMQERARRIGGNLAVHSTPGDGTLIETELPFSIQPSVPAETVSATQP